MNIMDKAKDRAILETDNEYVLNKIYFGTEGLTSASANHVSAMANLMVQDIKNDIKALRLYSKSMKLIDGAKMVVEERNNTLPFICDGIKKICKANALIAWLREAVKEREAALKSIKDMTIEKWAEKFGYDMPVAPTPPQSPKINFNDLDTIISTGLSVKEYNRFLEINTALAVYGEFIHDGGMLTKQKEMLSKYRMNPTEVHENGRDTLIYIYEVDNLSDIESIYTQLQSEYRKLQAEKNGIEAKFSNMAVEYQTRKNDEYLSELSKYRKDMEKYNSERKTLDCKMAESKKQMLDNIAAMKIIIPNDLECIYKELKGKYM